MVNLNAQKSREMVLKQVGEIKEIQSNDTFVYKLNHFYDIVPTDIYVKTNVEPEVFELLLAYILFEANEVEETYALGQEEIAHPILNELYGVDVLEKAKNYNEKFDLYYIWEKWCGLYSKVRELNVFEREGLRNELEKIILDKQ